MNRRDALKSIATLLGVGISAPIVSAVLSGCSTDISASDWQPSTLDREQHRLVAHIADMILPQTDTPSATAAGVDRFIDLILGNWYDDEQRERFLQGLNELKSGSTEDPPKPFLKLDPTRQQEIIRRFDSESIELRKAGEEELPFFAMMKQMTLVGYFTSEAGMTQAQDLIPIPGYYNGCTELGDTDKLWVAS